MKTARYIMNDMRKKEKNVVEIIREMKNISSLILDLAFAALVTGDKGLAKKVVELEEEMNILQYQLEMNIMLATRNPSQARDFIAINRISSAIEDISNASAELVDAILRGFPVEKSVANALTEEMKTRVTRVTKSRFAGKTTDDLRKNYDIIGIKKDGEWHYYPKENFLLSEGDTLIIRRK